MAEEEYTLEELVSEACIDRENYCNCCQKIWNTINNAPAGKEKEFCIEL